MPGYESILLRRYLYRILFKKLGKNSLFYSGANFTHAFNISIGDFCSFNAGSYIDGHGFIEIGDYCMIGPNSFVGSSNHFIKSSLNNPRLFLGHNKNETRIGANVWIGANVVVCPGVAIGDNSIVAAGSVVVENVIESVLVGGNPAKIIKKI